MEEGDEEEPPEKGHIAGSGVQNPIRSHVVKLQFPRLAHSAGSQRLKIPCPQVLQRSQRAVPPVSPPIDPPPIPPSPPIVPPIDPPATPPKEPPNPPEIPPNAPAIAPPSIPPPILPLIEPPSVPPVFPLTVPPSAPPVIPPPVPPPVLSTQRQFSQVLPAGHGGINCSPHCSPISKRPLPQRF